MKNVIKKLLSLFLVLTMTVGIAPLSGFVGLELPEVNFGIETEALTSGIYTYEVSGGKATITGCNLAATGDIVIPSNLGGYPVTAIGDSAFFNCAGIISVKIPDGVTEISDSAFMWCKNLKSVIIPDSVISIGAFAFEECSSLTTIELPDGITRISNFTFAHCKSLLSLTIPDSVTEIGVGAFQSCESFTSIIIPDSVTYLGGTLFTACTNLESVIIGDGVTSIDNHTFEFCDRIKSVVIGESVNSIKSYAFWCCESLTSIEIPESVTTIEPFAFDECYGLESFVVDENNQYYSNDNFGALYNKQKTELVRYPLGNQRESFELSDSVTSIASDAFRNVENLEMITVDSDNQYYSNDKYGVLYDKNKKNLIKYPIGNSRTMFEIPDSVININDNAFYSCNNIEIVIIGSNVQNICSGAFFNCDDLKTVIMGNKVKVIGDSAFSNCSSLEIVTTGNSITSIGEYSFSNCDSLKHFSMGNSVRNLGNYAFSSCDNLKKIIIGDHVTSIGLSAFSGCNKLDDVYYNNVKTEWKNISVKDRNKPLNDATIHFLREFCVNGHNYKTKVIYPTCTDRGCTIFICTRCGYTYSDNYIEKTHSYEASVIPPTCTEQGYTTYTCSNCGDSYKDNFLPALGMVNGVSVKDIVVIYKNEATIVPDVDCDDGVDYAVEYSSSDTAVATVDKNGLVTTTGIGEAEITVAVTDEYGNTVEDTCIVTVSYTWWQWLIVIFLFGWIWY